MRNVLVVCLFMTSLFIGYSQSECKTALIDGSLKAIVKDSIRDKDAADIYKKSLEWVAYTFRNTDAVSQSQVENKMIRITGISPNGVSGRLYGGLIHSDLKYTIQIDIKDQKIRFTVYDIYSKAKAAPYSEYTLNTLYKKNGEMKTNKNALTINESMNKTLSNLYKDYYKFLLSKSDSSSDDW